MEIQNVFAGCTIELEDGQEIKVADMGSMENHPHICGTVIVITDDLGKLHYFGAYEIVEMV